MTKNARRYLFGFFFFAIAIILFAYWEGKINKTTLFLDWKLSLKLICCKKQTK